MFRWDDAHILVAAFNARSLAEAGRELGVDTSTVSRRVRALEEALGVRLFDRTPDGLVPTKLAARLVPFAEQMEAAAHALSAEAAGQDTRPEGLVRIAVPDALAVYGVAPQLPRLLAEHPGVSVDILASTELVDMTRREADVALRFVRPQTGDLVARKIAAVGSYAGFVTRTFADHHDLNPDTIDWVGWSESKAHLPEAQLFQKLVGRRPRVAADSLVVQIEAARAGAGAILMPVAFQVFDDDVVQLPAPRLDDFEMDIYIVAHRALRNVPRVRAVIDWLAEVVVG